MDQPHRFGTVSRDQMMARSGLDLLRAMIAGELPAPPIAEVLGFTLVEAEHGRAVFEGTAGPQLFNPLGSVHGGFALTLIDSAAGCALHTALHAGVGYTTVETKANFVRPVPADGRKVRCEGRLLSHGRQIATSEADLRTADDDKLIAHGTSTLIILAPR